MKLLTKFFKDRFYVITTLPIAGIAYWLVQWSLFDGSFLPMMVLVLLALLTFAEQFVAFEIRRANSFLGCEILQPTRPWYTTSFWSWDGVKQRVTSKRAWLAIAYVFVALFFSASGSMLILLSVLSLLLLAFAAGIITPNVWERIYRFEDRDFYGRIELFSESDKFRIVFHESRWHRTLDSDTLTITYASAGVVTICLLILLTDFVAIPSSTALMKRFITRFLGGKNDRSGLAEYQKTSAKGDQIALGGGGESAGEGSGENLPGQQ